MSDSENLTNANSALSTVTGEITVASVIVFFMLFAVALILYLRMKGYSGAIGSFQSPSHRLIFAQNGPNVLKQTLDPSIIKSLPVIIFHPDDFKQEGEIQCAVCLAELVDGEKVRFLPKCEHRFHVECIDMWFHSNNTCPLCRNLVVVENSVYLVVVENSVSEKGQFAESKNIEAISDQGSSSSESVFSDKIRKGMLMSEIHRQVIEGQGIKSPTSERLRSLRRILSRGNLSSIDCVGDSYSRRSYDIEQGGLQNSMPVSETTSSL